MFACNVTIVRMLDAVSCPCSQLAGADSNPAAPAAVNRFADNTWVNRQVRKKRDREPRPKLPTLADTLSPECFQRQVFRPPPLPNAYR